MRYRKRLVSVSRYREQSQTETKFFQGIRRRRTPSGAAGTVRCTAFLEKMTSERIEFLVDLLDGSPLAAETRRGTLDGTEGEAGQKKDCGAVGGDVDVDHTVGTVGFYSPGQQKHDILIGQIEAEERKLAVAFGAADDDGQSEEVETGHFDVGLTDGFFLSVAEIDSVELLGGLDGGAAGKEKNGSGEDDDLFKHT